MDLRGLPAVDAVLSTDEAQALASRFPRSLVTTEVREALDRARARIRAGGDPGDTSPASILSQVAASITDALAARPPRVVNATGVILHTNLGRATLAPAAVEALVQAASSPVAVELDLESGERGERDAWLAPLLRKLTGAEDGLVVNNNAAALLLAVSTLADRREVLVSRGELIEIGGSFRLPDVLARGGAVLREVGTTNRTRVEDFAAVASRRTAMILRAHPSNYRIDGFTERPELSALAALARAHGIPLVEDLGSGALLDLERFGLPHEPTPADSIRAGVDLVTFSGDKLLGGPQAGIAVGRSALVRAMRRNPLRRALRIDKLTVAALGATLALHHADADPARALPTLRRLTRGVDELDVLASDACGLLRGVLGEPFAFEVVASTAEIGSGSQPSVELPSRAVAVTHRSWPAHRVAAYFRAARPPILGRVARDRLLLDVRCVDAARDLVPQRGDGVSP